ncbi:MAG TPA: protoporphyrinogen oxidase [Steroidobacteraceae bacterium]|nr:protoporphyrinogen oxidase [Steroidobacteraceae bacterium]
MRIGIVGAGLSGLATAFYVKRTRPDAELVVFEANPGPGGAMHTEVIEGFRFEAGPNGFLTNKPDCLQLVQDSGADAQLLPSSDVARKRFIFTDRLHRMPESPPLFVKSKLLSWPQKLRMAGELFVPARREGPEESLRDFGNRRLGEGFTSVFLDAMSAGIYGSTPDKLSVEAAFPLVVALEREYGGLFRGMIARRKKEAGPGGVLTSTKGGISTLANHLWRVTDADWRFGEPVRSIERAGAGFRITSTAGVTEVNRVVICATSYAAADMVQPLDAELALRLSAIDYSPIAVVGFGYRSLPDPLDGFGLLTTSSARLPILGVLWDSSIFPDRAPPGCKSIRVLLGGQRSPELVNQDEAGLIRTARAGLETSMGLTQDADVTFVKRWDRGIPSYAPGHIANVNAIFERVDAIPGLYLNCNAYRGIAMNDCARNSRELAARIAQDYQAMP